MIRTANPVLNEKVFAQSRGDTASGAMTIEGTVNKSTISVLVMLAAGYYAWSQPEIFVPKYLLFSLATIVLWLVMMFFKKTAAYLTVPFAALEGLSLGAISFVYSNAFYPGIVPQAIGLTTAILLGTLMAYQSRWIQVTDRMRRMFTVGMIGILLFYLATFILSLFGVPVYSVIGFASPFSIGLSILLTAFASFSLIMHFDYIEQASRSGAVPRYMEWYAAFGLLVTLVWLYVEILNLLAKLQSRD